jgi:hypothetical protein
MLKYRIKSQSVEFFSSLSSSISEKYIVLSTVGFKRITVTAQPETQNFFVRSNTGIVGSNPIRGVNVYLLFFFAVLSRVAIGLADGLHDTSTEPYQLSVGFIIS